MTSGDWPTRRQRRRRLEKPVECVRVCVLDHHHQSAEQKDHKKYTEKRKAPADSLLMSLRFPFLPLRQGSFFLIIPCMHKLLFWDYIFTGTAIVVVVFFFCFFLFLWSSCRFWATFSRSIAALDWVIAKPKESQILRFVFLSLPLLKPI